MPLLIRDDFLGMVELPLMNMAMEGPPGSETTVPHKHYLLRPRSARSKVRGHLQLYHGKKQKFPCQNLMLILKGQGKKVLNCDESQNKEFLFYDRMQILW